MITGVGHFDPYVDAWRARWRAERESDRQAAAAARVIAQRLAEVLRERYGARRVLLTGSLARGEFHRGSDIDLAVEGLRSDELFRAGAALTEDAGGLEVDLVPLESASAEYLARLEREGIILYEQRNA